MSTNNTVLLVWGLLFFWWITRFAYTPKDLSANWTNSAQVDTVKKSDSAKEVVAVWHNGRSLVPDEIVLQAGKDYEIQITPSSNGIGCMFEATVPKISNETYKIEAGKQFTINIPGAKPWRYPVVCTSMGMAQGTIVVQG